MSQRQRLNKHKEHLSVLKGLKCPFCGKNKAERVGVFNGKSLIGYLGLDCKGCKKQIFANRDNIETIQDNIFSLSKEKTGEACDNCGGLVIIAQGRKKCQSCGLCIDCG